MPAPSLRELQETFWRALAERPGASGSPALARPLLEVIPPSERLTPSDRLGIYAGMYFWRIVDALREDFPRVAAVLGDEGFADLARGYLARHPSSHPSLRHAGGALPDFIADQPPPGAPAFLADLARLERARVDAFDALDVAALRVDDLRAVPATDWPALRFAAVPAVAVLVSDWPVDRVWDDPAARDVPPERTTLRVWREGFAVYHARMDHAEARALARVLAGRSFAAVCDVLDQPETAGALLLRWIEDGLLRRF
jgi:hypothetical protein